MKKPVVKVKNYTINRFPFENSSYVLLGNVEDHPRFEKGERVRTSTIVRVETLNTIYELIK